MGERLAEHLDRPAAVRPGEELDAAALEAYLRRHLTEESPGELEGPLEIEQFPSGFSNLTYRLRLGRRDMVLRRPPFGNKVASAHDMGREHRVLSHLHEVYPLAPKPWLFCGDSDVIGAPFYVMERRHGVILRRQLPPGLTLDPETARRLSEALVDNLARLHGLDYEAAGLGDLGRPEGYAERQVRGWAERYERARTSAEGERDPIVLLGAWLAERVPAGDGAALLHNDYKFDNLLLDPEDLTRIVAVLDWEMCTLGDPLMDLGASLAYWVQGDDPEAFHGLLMGPSHVPGALSRRQLVERYAEQTGRDVSGILFYYVFGLFKLAVILQQIYARYARGFTKDPRFAPLDRLVAVLGYAGLRAVERGKIE